MAKQIQNIVHAKTNIKIMNHMLVLENNTPTSTVRKIDERKLNKHFDDLPDDVIKRLVRKQLPKPSKHRQSVRPTTKKPIPQNIRRAIVELGLLDISDFNERINIFTAYCLRKNYTFNTTHKYYWILRINGLFGQDPNVRKPDRRAFIESGSPHIRIVSMDKFRIFAKYLHENFNLTTAPLLVAIYTGLRTWEILQFSTYTLYQLKRRAETVFVKRKQTTVTPDNNEPIYWKPIYNSHFTTFIEHLIDLFGNEYKCFIEQKLNSQLFPVTPKTLNNCIKSYYYMATESVAPHGFGIHSCRNMIAMLMAQNTENVTAICNFLQHKKFATTQRYIKADFTFLKNEYNRITDYTLSSVRANLKPPATN